MNDKITLDQARKVLEVVDAGLCSGIGKPVPGQMCVEAAVCYALGQPHGDEPNCVNAVVRGFKIRLNDGPWSSNETRARGMRRLAIAQLGTSDKSFDEKKFVEVLVEQTIRKIVPHALRSALLLVKDVKHKAALEEAAVRCEREGNLEAAKNAQEAANDAAYAAYAAAPAANAPAAYAAYAAANDAAYAAYAAANDAAYAAYAAAAASYYYSAAHAAYAAGKAASTANAVDAYAAAYAGDAVLNMSADIGVQALRAAGAPGIELMDQLILVSDATRAATSLA